LSKFKLQSSIITIDYKRDEKGQPVGTQTVVVSVPAEEPSGQLYAIQSADLPGIVTARKQLAY
jgi:hypothetical protein